MKTEYKTDRRPAENVEESRAGYRAENDDVKFEICKSLGILRKNNTGWTRELNIVRWNGGSPRYDIRDWDPAHAKMSRGITFTKEEAVQICAWLKADGIGTSLGAGMDKGAKQPVFASAEDEGLEVNSCTPDPSDGPAEGFERVPDSEQGEVPF